MIFRAHELGLDACIATPAPEGHLRRKSRTRHPVPADDRPSARSLVSRREVVTTGIATGLALSLPTACGRSSERPAGPGVAEPQPTQGADVDVVLRVNGTDRALTIEPRVSLLDALRERLGLPGTKKGCDQGQCGACTVLVDGRRVLSCLILAVSAQGTPITTIEGLARDDQLHPVQDAFARLDALQCGYCTPGQIMSAVGLLSEGRARTDAEIREEMSGNICRCGAYPNIVAAVSVVRMGRAGRAGAGG
jgi:xanthine dehydrogenase YagT iron-sulfur-binding subunit